MSRLSDLHTEFAEFVPPETDAEAVILAGDIGVGVEGVRWAAHHYPMRPVIYVPGNHEFYGHDIDLTAPNSSSLSVARQSSLRIICLR